MQKRFLALMLSVVLLLGITACGENKPAQTDPPQLKEIKNIILIIGDGFGLEHMKASELVSGKETAYHNWANCLSDTTNVFGTTTDSAAAATAMATGTLTGGGIIGQDTAGKELKTIFDYAAEMGKATGIVTTDGLAGATPGGFSAHTPDRDEYDDIMIDQFRSGIRLLCGQQTSSALTLAAGNKYNFTYTVSRDLAEVEANMSAEMGYWQLPLEEDLTMAIEPALRYLDKDEDGFLLMIEQAHIDKYADDGDFEGVLRCVNDLNETVDIILNWLGDRTDTAIIVTADHETGALKVSTEESYFDSYTAENGTVVNYFFGTRKHSTTPVGVFVYGYTPDFSKYYMKDSTTTIKNSSIFNIMLDLLNEPMRY